MSQDIMFACWDRCHTQYTSTARVVSRTNRTIAPPTGTLKQREQDHRNQRIEEHMKVWEQSGATARGRFTLELLWPLTLPPDPTPDLGQPWLPWSDSRGFGSPGATLAVLSLTSSLTLPLDSRLDSRLTGRGLPCSRSVPFGLPS